MPGKSRSLTSAAIALLLAGFVFGFLVHWLSSPGRVTEAMLPAVQEGGVGHAPDEKADEAGVDDELRPPTRLEFDSLRALEDIRYLSSQVGYRPEGTAAEAKAADCIASRFSSFGYGEVGRQTFVLDNGATSRNVYVVDEGQDARLALVIGAHYDTAGGTGSPGANDNASGVGVLLELARIFRNNDNVPTLIFVAFGAEEILQGYGRDHHHYGSRYMAGRLHELGYTVVGMISIDMVGVGNTLVFNSTMQAPHLLLDLLTAHAGTLGLRPTFRQDPGWSDHEAFESHGIPSVWIEYREDPNYHTPSDTYEKLNPSHIAQIGRLLQTFLETLDREDLQELRSSTFYRQKPALNNMENCSSEGARECRGQSGGSCQR